MAFDRDEYNRIVAASQLIEVALVRSEFEVKPEYFEDAGGGRKLSTHQEIIGAECHSGIVIVVIKFAAKAKKGRKVALKSEALYNVVLSVPDDADIGMAEDFAKHMSRYTAYPYFRSHVAHHSWEAAADLPPLPIIKTLPRKKVSAAKEK